MTEKGLSRQSSEGSYDLEVPFGNKRNDDSGGTDPSSGSSSGNNLLQQSFDDILKLRRRRLMDACEHRKHRRDQGSFQLSSKEMEVEVFEGWRSEDDGATEALTDVVGGSVRSNRTADMNLSIQSRSTSHGGGGGGLFGGLSRKFKANDGFIDEELTTSDDMRSTSFSSGSDSARAGEGSKRYGLRPVDSVRKARDNRREKKQTQLEESLMNQLSHMQVGHESEMSEMELKLQQREAAIKTLEKALSLQTGTVDDLRNELDALRAKLMEHETRNSSKELEEKTSKVTARSPSPEAGLGSRRRPREYHNDAKNKEDHSSRRRASELTSPSNSSKWDSEEQKIDQNSRRESFAETSKGEYSLKDRHLRRESVVEKPRNHRHSRLESEDHGGRHSDRSEPTRSDRHGETITPPRDSVSRRDGDRLRRESLVSSDRRDSLRGRSRTETADRPHRSRSSDDCNWDDDEELFHRKASRSKSTDDLLYDEGREKRRDSLTEGGGANGHGHKQSSRSLLSEGTETRPKTLEEKILKDRSKAERRAKLGERRGSRRSLVDNSDAFSRSAASTRSAYIEPLSQRLANAGVIGGNRSSDHARELPSSRSRSVSLGRPGLQRGYSERLSPRSRKL